MSSYIEFVLINGTISSTGGQSVLRVSENGRNPIMLYNVSAAGTTVTLQLQHSANGVSFSTVNSISSALTATGQTVSQQLTSNNYNSLLPFVRLNVNSITGSFTLTAKLFLELF